MVVLTRRGFLGGTAAIAAIAAVAALGGAVTFGVLPGPAEGFTVLSADEAALVRAVYDAMFPPGNPFGVAGRDVDLAPRLDLAFADEVDPELVPAFRYILRGIDTSALATHGRSFAALDFEGRRDVLAGWTNPENLPRRMVWEVVKVPLAMVWFGQPAVLAAIGWRAECAVGTT